MKSNISNTLVRLALILVALTAMLVIFVSYASADSPPNRCGLLPCPDPVPSQCAGGTGEACKVRNTPTVAERSRPTPTSAPTEARLEHRLLAPVERIVKPLR